METVLKGKISVIKAWYNEEREEFNGIVFELEGKTCFSENLIANKIARLPRGCDVIATGYTNDSKLLVHMNCGRNVTPQVIIKSVEIKK